MMSITPSFKFCTVSDAKSGELKKNLSEKAKDIIEEVQTDEFKQKASETLTNLKDGVVDILDGKENKA